MNKIKKWEIWGAVVSIVFGSLFHFVFDWSGGLKIVALFGAVNESTWEHLKLAFWPTFVFSIIEWYQFRSEIKNFCLATLVKLVSMPLVIVLLFYGWLAFFKDNFIYDISIFMVAVIVGYYLSWKIINSNREYGRQAFWALLIAVLLVCYSLFTYYPPKFFLTHDPVNGGYGIEK